MLPVERQRQRSCQKWHPVCIQSILLLPPIPPMTIKYIVCNLQVAITVVGVHTVKVSVCVDENDVDVVVEVDVRVVVIQ